MGTVLFGEAVEGVVDVERPKPYERMEGEPVDWFARFQHFLLQGRGRTIQAVYVAEAAQGHLRGQRGPAGVAVGQEIHVPGSWKAAVARFDWYARASAYDLEQLAADKRQVETDRAKRRQAVIEDEWQDSQQMLSAARESLKHGNKFFERTVRLQPGKFVESREIDLKTGREIIVRTKVDREIVYIEHKLGDVRAMLMDGAKKARQAVNMTDSKVQEEFVNRQTGEVMDVDAVDREIYEIFEALGANSYKPPALPAPDADDLPDGLLDADGPPDEVWPGGSV